LIIAIIDASFRYYAYFFHYFRHYAISLALRFHAAAIIDTPLLILRQLSLFHYASFRSPLPLPFR
jgi:hypothetical protein